MISCIWVSKKILKKEKRNEEDFFTGIDDGDFFHGVFW